jgi:CubicO group peptidase (beta-lactamase class C family)
LAAEGQWSGTLLVARDGHILSAEAHGLADREAGVPISLDTRFRMGSMNKMFTGVATLQLIGAGRLALDDRIAEVLPNYPNTDVASQVTVRHLLTHTGGTGDIFGSEFIRNRDS